MRANVDEDNYLSTILKNGSVVAAHINASATWVRSVDWMIIKYSVGFILHK